MPAPLDPADVLLSKASEDHHLASQVAGDASVSNEHVGFFCQQAIEKSIKSVLSRRLIRYLARTTRQNCLTSLAIIESSIHSSWRTPSR
jgi:hypothetical protein